MQKGKGRQNHRKIQGIRRNAHIHPLYVPQVSIPLFNLGHIFQNLRWFIQACRYECGLCKSGAADRSSEWFVHFSNQIIILEYRYVLFLQAAGQNEKLWPQFSLLAANVKALESNYHFMPSHDASKTENEMESCLSVHYSAQEQRDKYSACILGLSKIPARLPFIVDTMCYHTIVLIIKEDFPWISKYKTLPEVVLDLKQNMHTRTYVC